MKLSDGSHLTYCTNIHPGEDWPTLVQNLRRYLPAIKKRVNPDTPFGVGLRLSAIAARYLCDNYTALIEFKHWLNEENLYVFTLNGFPYGTFHGQPVKEQVYQPDWQTEERFIYSCQLAEILSELLPKGIQGSISTVPVGFKPNFCNTTAVHMAANNLKRLAHFLAELKTQTSNTIQLALEPEPGCYLETTQDTLNFFQQFMFTASDAENKLLKEYIGVCLDTCHAAVMFEDSVESAQQLLTAEIPIYKIQLTAALHIPNLNDDMRTQLSAFTDNVYLHQTSVRHNDEQHFFMDLQPALNKAANHSDLRSHFHVPVFCASMGLLQTTQRDLLTLLAQQKKHMITAHLEVETYTFDVLPSHLRASSVVDNISRELLWIKDKLQ
ncbi:metabolite traffic protein EboE [Teredinibacter purpureus]|uniref:metabolite traffic protein EboE n=1 Tax=Teredinibacter purpureus TaxID=2731756 RepID=UPI0005F79D55|nr:metabolite traffic protein EboE [Teredinibacter purpureus]